MKNGGKQPDGYKTILAWFRAKNRRPFPFQEETWQHFLAGKSGLLNAPTGFGKTFALFLPIIIDWINRHDDWQQRSNNGLQMLWITPLRALAKDLQRAMQEVCTEIGLPWQIGLRSGDTSDAVRQKQKKLMPEVLIITPESLHLLLAQKGHPAFFKKLRAVVVDEWHELLGSKRGRVGRTGTQQTQKNSECGIRGAEYRFTDSAIRNPYSNLGYFRYYRQYGRGDGSAAWN